MTENKPYQVTKHCNSIIVAYTYVVFLAFPFVLHAQHEWEWQSPNGPPVMFPTGLLERDGVVIATGAPGTILRSTDDGMTWTTVLRTDSIPWISTVVSRAPGHCVATGSFGAVLHSPDSGRTWRPARLPVTSDVDAAAFPVPDRGWVCGMDGAFFRTTDGGATWTDVAVTVDEHLSALCFLDERTGWAVGSNGTVLRTADGEQWTGHVRALPGWLHAVDFIDANQGCVGGSQGRIWATSDGGQQWHPVFEDSAATILSLRFLDSRNGIATGGHGVFYRTDDGGWTWTAVPVASDAVIGAVLPGPRAWIALADDGAFYRSTDGGLRWERSIAALPAHLHRIRFATPTDGWSVGKRSTVLRTTDGGGSWERRTVPGPSRTLTALAASAPASAWIGASDGSVLRTEDGGMTWTERSLGPEAILDLSAPAERQAVAVDAAGSIFVTVDATTWMTRSAGTDEPLLCVDARANGRIRIGGARGQVYLSSDGGAVWQAAPRFTDAAVLDIHFPTDSLGFCSDLGGAFFRSTDAGHSWRRVFADSGSVLVSLRMSADGLRGHAATLDGRIRETIDGGETWVDRFDAAVPLAEIDVREEDLWAAGYAGSIVHARGVATGIRSRDAAATALDLQVYPNPAGGHSTLRIALRRAGSVRIELHDTQGRLIETLHEGKRAPGLHERHIDTRRLPSGVYHCRVTAGGESRTVLLRIAR